MKSDISFGIEPCIQYTVIIYKESQNDKALGH